MADTKLSALTEVSIPDFDDDLYLVDNTGPTSYKIGVDRVFGLLTHLCQGRLTLTTALPITTADVTAATTIYFTPYAGDKVALYDGTRWRLYQFTEMTLALGTLSSGKPYDVFLYDNAGTLTLEALVWTNDTTRATALVLQNGIKCKSGALTRRYLGTFYTTATTTTEDSARNRYLWNEYNRVSRPLSSGFVSDPHTYATATWREWRAGTNSVPCRFVLGDATSVIYGIFGEMTATTGSTPYISANIDVTTANGGFFPGSSVVTNMGIGAFRGGVFVAAGRHILYPIEFGATSTSFVDYQMTGDFLG